MKKYDISFEEAKSVFYDDNAIQFWDEQHSDFEDRFLLLGISSKMRILLIVHCYREQESVIRIISARKATKNESQLYGK
ncbi:BrnT family toxin [Okeania sp. KiyG1]|uniref:BrnT family toxin n=1 Tax=Okeania sp. KiyG1 TaxID=2720165 RepID=UPI0035C8811E